MTSIKFFYHIRWTMASWVERPRSIHSSEYFYELYYGWWNYWPSLSVTAALEQKLGWGGTKRQLVYTMFIINNHTLANLAKHQKVSECYDHDCLQNFILLLMSLLTASVVKNSQIMAEIYLYFLKSCQIPNLKIWTSMKRLEKNLSSKTNLSTFWKLVTLILG